ncbi:shikimate dehydrogenase [Roseomonas sp. M0104]|uniref:shikimate dehydrogenase (NADP(+)) n=1 Tax=Teichococcus coralli TaxID=2545983 RepID=A0A845BAD4_9PROT|nr:shikimate dehydrogenase [Pseudoroseomonas coralli]MXP63046.1 shikimate dehydrogenase [Pseudoroseomonas coralli]
MTEITGRTRIWGILADPIHHVKTPQALNAMMRERGVDGVMVPIHVGPADLPALVAGLRQMRNLHGLIVTVPHKTAMLDLCDETSAAAKQSGAVNAVRIADGRLSGTMLDGAGFVGGLRAGGIEPRGMRAYLAGAGGAANAIAFALAEAGVARLTLANRTRAKAEALRDRVAAAYPGVPVEVGGADPAGHDLLVNGTSLGLAEGDALPFAVENIGPSQTVAEVIMQPTVTPLLAEATKRGCRTHPGMPMLTSQLNLMAEYLGMTA